jgi:predicted kinase
MASLTLIRGVSGSGKTTLANRLVDSNSRAIFFEADLYFEKSGVYRFDVSKIGEAHDWCYNNAEACYNMNYDVIVSNTFTRKWEMERYFVIDPNPQVIICQGRFQNIHGTSPEMVQKQLDRFEY